MPLLTLLNRPSSPENSRRQPLLQTLAQKLRIAAPLSLALSLALTFGHGAQAQSSSESSSSNGTHSSTPQETAPAPRIAQPEAAGSAITLETSEPLFDLAVALNACGYDADLAASAPVRLVIRSEVNIALAASAEARVSRDALCSYVR